MNPRYATEYYKIWNRRHGKHSGEIGEAPAETVKALDETPRNTIENGRKFLGNRGSIAFRESPW